MSVTAKRSKAERSKADTQPKLQKELQKLRTENESLKATLKQKDARLSALSASFDSASIPKNVVEAFDMESLFRQAAIDAQEHVQQLLKTIQIKPEDYEAVKADLDKTRNELAHTRMEKAFLEKQINFKKKETEKLLEEIRSLTLKSQEFPNSSDFRTLEINYRNRIIALREDVKKKDFLLGQYTSKLPSILSKDHTSGEYLKLEEDLKEANEKVATLSCVLVENGDLKANILELQRKNDVLKECVSALQAETEELQDRIEKHERFERSLPPDAKTSVVLQEELVAKDLLLKRQHDDFVKQLNAMQETVAFLRVQHEKHICVQKELDRKTDELRKLKEETKSVTQTVGAKEQHIKDLENHFVIRRSGLQHTITGLEERLKSTKEELSDSKRTIAKLIEENKRLSQRCMVSPISTEPLNGGTLREVKVESEFYKQQLLDLQQLLREEKRQHWKAKDKIKQLEIACHEAFDKIMLKEKETQSKAQTQRILLERKDRTINELRKLSLEINYAEKLPK